MKYSLFGLSLDDALVIKGAQFWLLLGQPKEALAELEALSFGARETAWAKAVYGYALREVEKLSEAGLSA